MGDLLTLTNDLGRLVADATSLETSVGDPLRPAAPPAATVTLPTLTELADGRTFQASWVVRLHGIATSGAGFATLLDAAELLLAALVESSNPFRWAGATPALSALAAGDAPAYVVTVTAELGAVIPVEGVPPQHGTATLTATATLIATGQGGNARGVVTLTAVGTLSAGGHGATLTATATLSATGTLSAGGHGATLVAGSTLSATGTLTAAGHVVSAGLPVVTGLQIRYDPSNAASITSSGGLVSQLADLSGFNRHAVQGTSANQPVTGTRTIGGLNALDYVNDLLDVVTYVDQPLTVFMVAASDNPDSATHMAMAQFNGATSWLGVSADRYYWKGIDTGVTENADPHLFSLHLNGASSAAYVDGTAVGTGDAAATPLYNWFLGSDTVNHWDGPIGELLVYAPALNTTDRQSVENYLRAKWGTPAAGTPATVPGLAAHWDASNAASITSSGGLVSQWADASGQGHHLVQGTGANQPVTGSRTQNGLNVIDFVAAGDFLNTAGFNFVSEITQPYTVVMVAKKDNAAVGETLMDSNRRVIVGSTGVNWGIYAGSVLDSAVPMTASATVIAAVYNGAASKLTINGGTTVTGAAGGNTLGGNPSVIVGGDVGAPSLDGYVCELLIYAGDKTADLPALTTYLKTKWGIA